MLDPGGGDPTNRRSVIALVLGIILGAPWVLIGTGVVAETLAFVSLAVLGLVAIVVAAAALDRRTSVLFAVSATLTAIAGVWVGSLASGGLDDWTAAWLLMFSVAALAVATLGWVVGAIARLVRR